MAGVHDVFHVYMLRKHVRDGEQDSIVDYRGLDIHPDVSVDVLPLKIVDVQEKGTRNKRIKMVKVQWSDNDHDVTWELETEMREAYPDLFLERDLALDVET